MSLARRLLTIGTAAVVALTLFSVPASATTAPQPSFARVAEIDCGSGPIQVGSNDSLWAPLVDLRTGDRYKPVAWNVSGEGFSFAVSKNQTKDAGVCTYDDGEASGTVTVKPV